MRSLLIRELIDDISQHHVATVDDPPQPEGETVLVQVHSVGLNFFDGLMIQGKYQTKPNLPFIPGSEFSGVVAAIGPSVTSFKVGDRVFGSLMMGAFSSIVAVEQMQLRQMLDGMTFEHAAAYGMVYPTSYVGLKFRGHLKPGETLLVHAGAGGVGMAAIQIGKAFGARVIATVDFGLNLRDTMSCIEVGSNEIK